VQFDRERTLVQMLSPDLGLEAPLDLAEQLVAV
jgi:hypothetical protein